MGDKKFKLRGLVIDRVDLVDKGANHDRKTGDGSHVMLFKRAGDEPTQEDFDADALTLIEMSASIEKVGKKISTARMKELQAAHAALGKVITECVGDLEDSMPVEKSAEQIAAEQKAQSEAIQKAVETAVAAEVAKVQKAADDKVTAIQKAADERVEKAEAAAKLAGEVAKGEKDLRVEKEFAQRISSDFAKLAMKPEDAKLLKSMSEKLTADEFKRVEEVLKSANEAIAKGAMFEEIGTKVTKGAAGSAKAEIIAKAEEMVTKGTVKTVADGITKIAMEDGELYNRYMVEQRAEAKSA